MSPRDSLLQAARAMVELDIGALPIVDNVRLIGVITDRDIVLRGVAFELPMSTTPIDTVMSKHVECVFEDEGLNEVIAKMQETQIRRLPVLDDAQRVVGMLSLGDMAAKSDPEVAGFMLAVISDPARPIVHKRSEPRCA